MLGGKVFVDGFQRQPGLAVIQPNAGHDAYSLGFNEDHALLAQLGADRLAEIVVGAHKPFPVPAVLIDGLLHFGCCRHVVFGFVVQVPLRGDGG